MLDEITRLTAHDLHDCLALALDRGWAPEERLWSMLLEVGDGYGIRDEAGSLVGTTILTRYGHDLAAVGMVLVATRHGGRGIGRRLVDYVLAEAGDATTFLYATEHGRPLYDKLGFTSVGTAHTHVGEFAPAAGPGRGGVGTTGPAAADLDALSTLDAAVCGADRTVLVRRLPTFAERMLVVASGGRVTGYASRWSGATATVIGPVIAETPEHAELLIGELAEPVSGPVRVELDGGHPALRGWAAEHGLAPRGATTVMVRGTSRLPGDRSRWFAPMSLALG